MKKKIILGVTLFLMLLTLFALSVSAAETIETWDISATESDNVTATLYDDYSLVISGTGNMKDWTSSSSAPWYSSYRDKIKSITIEEGVTTIGDDAFRGCSSLTSVVIPDSVTTIGYRAFSSCDALTSVVIGDSVTTIGARAFFNCDSLVGVEIPDSVTVIEERAFYDCDALINIELPGSVTTVGSSAFASCDSLTSIKIPDSVTVISNYAFDYCPSLTIYREAPSTPNGWSSEWNSYDCPVVVGFYIDGWDVSLKNDGSVMAYLEEIWDDEGYYTLIITGTGDMKGWSFFSSLPWWNCYRHNIKSAVIEEGITNIGTYAFGVCGSMTSIKIPDSVTSIGDNAFYSCDSLTSIVIGNSVTTIGDSAFLGCSSLTIYAEAASKPSGWNSNWNNSNRPVVWGHTHTYENHKCVCGMDEPYIEKWNISAAESDHVTATLYDDGSFVISGTGAMQDWTSYPYAPWWYSYGYRIKSVTIEDGVTTIGYYAFYNCDSLTSVVIPDSVTSICSWAFYNCDSLTSVVIGDSVPTIGEYAFSSCHSLTSIEVSENNTAYCDIDGNLYTKDKKTLVQYAIGKKDTSFTIPDSVTTIGSYAFYDCSLTSVVIGDSVKNISYSAFYSCDSLTSIVIPDSVTTIGDHAFRDCSSLTSVVIPDSVITIGDSAFLGCSSLTIYAEAASKPSGWNSNWNNSNRPVVWGHTHTYDSATNLCVCGAKAPYIAKWDISATSSDNVTATLYDDGSLVITGTGNMKDWDWDGAPWYSSSYRSKIKSITIEEGVATIGERAFYNCDSLTSIVIGESVTTIGDYAFYDCSALTSVVIGDSVTTIGSWAFWYCRSLTSVVIGDSVTTIGNYAFRNCDSLTSIEVSENNTAYCDIDGNLYTKDKKTLVQYAIGKKDTSFTIPDSVTTIGYAAFEYCNSLTSVVIPDSVTTIGNVAFCYCGSLKSIVIPDSVTTIGNYAFEDCDSLTSVVIGDSVTTIGERAFYFCDSLTSVVIPDSVTTIGNYAFAYCNSLTSIVIPDSVTTIGYFALYYCHSLTIYCEAPSQPSGWDSKWNSSNRPVVWGYFDKEVALSEIFTFLGYSFNEEGSMAVGYEINYEALRLYEEKTGETLEIGVVFAGYSLLNGNQPLDNEGNAIELTDGAVVKFDLTEYDYTYYDFIVTDIIDSIKDIPLVISAYINNGEENKYIQENGIADTVTGISYNEAKE